MTVHVGMMVIYVPRPGRRETEMAAMVTAVYPDDRCDLNIYPPMAEFYQQPKVPMLSEMFKTHVWMVPPPMRVPLMAEGEDVDADLLSPGHIVNAPAKRSSGRRENA